MRVSKTQQHPEIDDPTVTAGEHNSMLSYPMLSLKEIRTMTPGEMNTARDVRRRTGGQIGGPITAGSTQTTNAVAPTNVKPAAVPQSFQGAQKKNGNVADQSVPWEQRKTANGRTTGLGGRVIAPGKIISEQRTSEPAGTIIERQVQSPVIETDQQAQARILGKRPSGLAVSAKGDASALDKAGSSAGGLESLREYQPTKEPVSLPVTDYTPASNEARPSPLPTPTATPAPPPPTPTPEPTPYPSPTPFGGFAAAGSNPTAAATPAATSTPADPYANAGPGKSIASGVSNSQAAGFEQPTADNPLPKTPTSPVLNIDDEKKRRQFAGF